MGVWTDFFCKVMWLSTCYTSSDPHVIAGYYMDCVAECGGTAHIIRTDRGTENVMGDLQRFLRRNGGDAKRRDRSFLVGTSTANQRVEYWWGFLRRQCTNFWMDLFKQLQNDGM